MSGIRILLIDDDYNYFQLASRMLENTEQNFIVDWAGNYTDGLDAMLKQQHDVYLVDYLLGEHTGIELMTEAMNKGVTTPVIMMTSQGEHRIDLESLKAGAADYVDKVELKPEALRRAIRYTLERNQVIQQLRESEERYRHLIDDAYDGLLITDTSGKITLANNRAADLLGHTAEGLLNKSIQDVIPGIVLPGKENKATQEHQLQKGDDQTLHIEINAKRLDDNQFQYIIRDISQQKISLKERDRHIEQLMILHQVDAELSQIENIESVLALALDAAVRLSAADAGFIGLLDNNQIKLAQAIGHYASIMPDDTVPESTLIRRIIDEPEPRLIPDVDKEPGYVRNNPKTRAQMILPMMSFERMIGILNLETSKPERFAQETFDFLKLIAARVAVAVENAQFYKIAQDQLAQLQELYEQVKGLEQIKTDMIRIAAHDLRNPVSVILGYTELMRRLVTDPDGKIENFLNMIERAARRMEKITTDILSLERIENLQADQGVPISFKTLVSDTFREFENQAADKSQKYTLETTAEGDLQVRGDSAQLREAVANLISNAIKYTPREGSITVRLDQEDDHTVFKVEDTGYGIPQEQQHNLFQPFYRAHSKETTDIEGTGLGLYLIKNIVERYKGTIIFTSVYGEGSTFGFRLPVVHS